MKDEELKECIEKIVAKQCYTACYTMCLVIGKIIDDRNKNRSTTINLVEYWDKAVKDCGTVVL